MLLSILLCVSAAAALGAPSWPIMFAYSPDSLPTIDVRLAPPHKQMPEVSASLSQLDEARAAFESEHLRQVEEAYNTSLSSGVEKIAATIDQLMRIFQKPTALVSRRHQQQEHLNSAPWSPSLREARQQLGGHELTARIDVLPLPSPDALIESGIEAIERKRSRDEGNIFRQAVAEMSALTQIVQNEVEVQVARHGNSILHTAMFGNVGTHAFLPKSASPGLLSASQPALASGLQLTTNVRVAASEEPFHTVSALVEDMERRRDTSEDMIRKRLLELELKLLQAENDVISHHLGGWMTQLLQSSA